MSAFELWSTICYPLSSLLVLLSAVMVMATERRNSRRRKEMNEVLIDIVKKTVEENREECRNDVELCIAKYDALKDELIDVQRRLAEAEKELQHERQ